MSEAKNDTAPVCTVCEDPISRPKDLRSYDGKTFQHAGGCYDRALAEQRSAEEAPEDRKQPPKPLAQVLQEALIGPPAPPPKPKLSDRLSEAFAVVTLACGTVFVVAATAWVLLWLF